MSRAPSRSCTIYGLANFKLLNHTLLCSRSTRFTPMWVVCNLHSRLWPISLQFIIHFLITICCLLVGFVHRMTMNDYLHSIRKSLKACADNTRYTSCCYLGGLPRVWASVLSMGKLSVCALKIDMGGLGLYHFISAR